jgi:hypothetical protein
MRASRLSCSAGSFFEPRQLRTQLANLRVELVHLLGVGSILRGSLFTRPAREQAGKAGQRDLAPAIELIGMDAVLSGELADGLPPLE